MSSFPFILTRYTTCVLLLLLCTFGIYHAVADGNNCQIGDISTDDSTWLVGNNSIEPSTSQLGSIVGKKITLASSSNVEYSSSCTVSSFIKELRAIDVVVRGKCDVLIEVVLRGESSSGQVTIPIALVGSTGVSTTQNHRVFVPLKEWYVSVNFMNSGDEDCEFELASVLYTLAVNEQIAHHYNTKAMKKHAILLSPPSGLKDSGEVKNALHNQKWTSAGWEAMTFAAPALGQKLHYRVGFGKSDPMHVDLAWNPVDKQDVVIVKARVAINNLLTGRAPNDGLTVSVVAFKSVNSTMEVTYAASNSLSREYFPHENFVLSGTLFGDVATQEYPRLAVRVGAFIPPGTTTVRILLTPNTSTEESVTDLFHVFDISVGRYGEAQAKASTAAQQTSGSKKEDIPGWGIALLVIFCIIIVLVIPCGLYLWSWYRRTKAQQFRIVQPGTMEIHDGMDAMMSSADAELEVANEVAQ